jgi:hypothetical protein
VILSRSKQKCTSRELLLSRCTQEARIFRAFFPIARTFGRSSGATEQNLFLNCPQKQRIYVSCTGILIVSTPFISTYKCTYSLSSPAQPLTRKLFNSHISLCEDVMQWFTVVLTWLPGLLPFSSWFTSNPYLQSASQQQATVFALIVSGQLSLYLY